MSLEDLLKEKPELKTEIDKLVEAQATSIASKTSQGLLDKNTELMNELKPLQELKKQLGDDFSFEEYKKLRQDLADKEKQGFVEKGELSKLVEAHDLEKTAWQEEHNKAVGEKDQKIQTLQSQLEKEVVDNQLMRHLSGIAVDEGSLEYLMIKARSLVEMAEVNGELVARVKNGIKADGTYKSIKELAKDFSEDDSFARFVKGVNADGSGAPNGNVPAGGGGKKRSEMSVTEKAAYVNKHGQAAYLGLPA